MDEIKVRVVEFGDRKHYQMQYRDPMNGRKVTRSTGVECSGRKRERTEAERVAAKWEAEVREGRYHSPSKITWQDFRERYEREVLSGLAQTTDLKVSGVFNAIENILNPTRLNELTAARLSHFQAKLREGEPARGDQPAVPGRAESTIAGHLAHLRAALQWAVDMAMLAAVPKIQKPKRAKGASAMKGRPITGEEFDRMLHKVEAVVGPERAPSWMHYLRGLWWSGLRLEESLELWWDRDDRLCVDLSGKRPMLRIPAALEKGNQDRHLAMAPEFAELLSDTPEGERTGRVFNLMPARAHGDRLGKDAVSRTVAAIGEAAGIKVLTNPATGAVKYASAHDLRRSFGERWSIRVMPQVLMQLMRHESIDTTMRFYVGRNAQTTADVLWEAHRATMTNANPVAVECTPSSLESAKNE